MIRKVMIVAICMIAVLAALPAGAQESSARLRVGAYFYLELDVYVDGELAIEHLRYPFVSDYLDLAPGAHTIEVTEIGVEPDGTATLEVDLTAGHDVLVAAGGHWEEDDAPTLFWVDETEGLAGLDPEANPVMVMHLLAGIPAVTLTIDGEPIVEDLAYGAAAFFEAPDQQFRGTLTSADDPDTVILDDNFDSIPQGLALAAILGNSPDAAFVQINVRSDLTIADYLAALNEPEPRFGLSAFYELLQASGQMDTLSAEGPITVFAPNDDAFEEMPPKLADALQEDSDLLAQTILYHVVPELVPPSDLPYYDTLDTLAGSPLTLQFPEDAWWTINDRAPIYTHVRLGNGYLYEIGWVLTPPQE